jgi:hypothetical protein
LGIFELSPVQISSYPSPAYPHANINISASFRAGTYRKTSEVKVVLEALSSICANIAAFLMKTVI